MVQDPRTERLLGDIELVRSRGDPARGRLCVMSLVAVLAGEVHSDRPASASPLIAAFARPVNDAMDRATRQRLIPFAPRILGTVAGDDALRREIVQAELMHTLLPAIVTDLQAGAHDHAQRRAAELTAMLAGELAATPVDRQPALAQDAGWDHAALIGPLRVAITAYRDCAGVQQAEAVARLLIAAVSCLARPTRRAWYWDRAIGLLDRLCEVGREAAVPAGREDVESNRRNVTA
ncbi:hypothetical protein [Ferruginivarius sediminum]|uniref:Uncharacterized protein n=1 Tax=Ferruginivarius sediminum TaxID=2661937 RepID=A0A369TAU1_9PROT|nr:hypothetical protein [Ferruginivarius sediminum]RDD61495.1 hypothetical protein DRB17_12390 [Ferruginivarius sediminum]